MSQLDADRLKLFTGRANPTLAQKICDYLQIPLGRGRTHILLNFDEVFYVDSSGLGELVMSHKRVNDAGGKLKLMKLNQITRDLIQITRLYTVFEVFSDEKAALQSFGS